MSGSLPGIDRKDFIKTKEELDKEIHKEMTETPPMDPKVVEQILAEAEKQKESIPEINIDEESSPESMHDFFENKPDVKSTFSKIIDKISSSLTSSPSTSNIGLQPSLSPLKDIKELETPFGDKNIDLGDQIYKTEEITKEIKGKTFFDLEKENKAEIDKIISSTLHLDSVEVIKKIKEKFPEYDDSTYRNNWITINNAAFDEEKDPIKRKLFIENETKANLKIIENVKENLTTRNIKNLANENYTHASLLNEIKEKASTSKLSETINQDLPPTEQEYKKEIENILHESPWINKSDINKKLSEKFNKYDPNNYNPKIFSDEQEIRTQGIIDTAQYIIKEQVIHTLDYYPNCNKDKLIKIINETQHLNPNSIINEIQKEIPNYDQKHFRKVLVGTTEALFESGLSKEGSKAGKSILIKSDLNAIHQLKGKLSSSEIDKMLNENYTHNSLLNQIKNKSLQKKASSSNITEQYEDEQNLFE